MPPNSFFFTPDMYNHYPKISTRFYLKKFMKYFKTLSDKDQSWFTNHPQFRHILHMPLHESRMCMPIWMLLVRAVETGDRSQVWFVVNGVPIRYSIREHGILSGLKCENYSDDLQNLGGTRLMNKYFKGKYPKLKDVQGVVMKMHKSDVDKLRLTVLLFLAMVIKKQSREEEKITKFLVKVVDDLDLCKRFPWGRFTYEDVVSNVYKSIDKYKAGSGGATKTDVLPGFILPLEVLAFECIDALKSSFRETVDAPSDDCPPLCAAKFKKCGQKGYTLKQIHDCVGESREIHSTVYRDEEYDDELSQSSLFVGNPIVDGWNKIISRGGTIFWEEMYRSDIASRDLPYVLIDPSIEPLGVNPSETTRVETEDKTPKARKTRKARPTAEGPSEQGGYQMVIEAVNQLRREMVEGLATMNTKVASIDLEVHELRSRMEDVEKDRKESGGFEDFGNVGDEVESEEDEEKKEEEEVSDEDLEEEKEKEEEKVEDVDQEIEKQVEEAKEKRKRDPSKYLKTPYERRSKRTKKA